MTDHLEIPIEGKHEDVRLVVYPQSSKAKIFEENDLSSGESRWQLVEGEEYEYEFTQNGYSFKTNELVSPSKSNASRGLIKTGVYVGCLTLKVVDSAENEIGEVEFEVRSVKVDYRTDYKTMLHDITHHFTELVMMQGAPVTQRFEVNPDEDSRTLYQQFAFMKSLIDSEEFEDALNKILYNPIRKWTGTMIEKDICSVKRLGRHELKQVASSKNRIPLDERCRIDVNLPSVPRRITVPYKKDTVDVAENQFVKFVLLSFSSFCSVIQQCKNATQRLKNEAELTNNKLAALLNNNFFREISNLQIASLNSPALQRKEGYREVLQAWMMSKMAAQISWKGGDNVYNAGKRNVAALYEYWVFFKLLDIVKGTFLLEQTKSDEGKLVKTDKDNINLELRQGHMKMIGGIYRTPTRTLKVRLYYNRTFSKSKAIEESGSWTTAMRPDYTLSIWPGNIEEKEAEEQDLIIHIHFDAKYKLHKIILDEQNADEHFDYEDDDTLSEEEMLMNQEKTEEEKGIYKRVDLLKMHAYKDAIRRTSGAYIIYPGTEHKKLKGFHEILPGLGAFCLNPNSVENDSKELELFLQDVVEHMLNRTSQRERIAYHTYETYKNEPFIMCESLPEPYGENRDLIPDETYVLLGYYKNQEHLDWILKNNLYNGRAGIRKGSIHINKEIASAKYLLLHTQSGESHLYKLKINGPRVYDHNELAKLDYPFSNEEESDDSVYLMFEINSKGIEPELMHYEWNSSNIPSLSKKNRFRVSTIKLTELIRFAKHNQNNP